MNPLDSRPSLGACNAAAGLGLAASNWQRAPRPPVRMAAAPLISPSAAHHTLTPPGAPLAQPTRAAAGIAAAPPEPVAPPAPRAPAASTATQTDRHAVQQAVRVSVRGPGPQSAGGRSSPQAAIGAGGSVLASPAQAGTPAARAGSSAAGHTTVRATASALAPAQATSRQAPSDTLARRPESGALRAATTWLAAEPPAPWAARPWPVQDRPHGGASSSRAAQPAPARPVRARAGSREVVFEFIGQGALSVLSSITGRCYRFEQPGARLVVDSRDVGQLARVSLLRCLDAAG